MTAAVAEDTREMRVAIVRLHVVRVLEELAAPENAPMDYVRGEFEKQAVRVAQARRMRVWKGRTFKHRVRSAHSSLEVLLDGRAMLDGSAGRYRESHGNWGWVLDIWEATIAAYDEMNRQSRIPVGIPNPTLVQRLDSAYERDDREAFEAALREVEEALQ